MNSNSTFQVSDPAKKRDDQFLEVLHESTHIRRHAQLFTWLQGDMQSLLPHEVLLLAEGDFSRNGKLHYDVISAILGVRTTGFSHVDLEDLIRGLYERWVSHGCTAYVLDASSSGVILNSTCQCALHRALRSMRSLLVHGMRDERSGRDVLYVAFRRNGQFESETQRMFEILLPHIDCAARRISALPDDGEPETKAAAAFDFAPLTERESEILHWVGNGKTNYEIGIILSISPFTVKNHLQRIFRKIDVSNRAQAVLRFETLNRQRQ